jgi:hypothetical protein
LKATLFGFLVIGASSSFHTIPVAAAAAVAAVEFVAAIALAVYLLLPSISCLDQNISPRPSDSGKYEGLKGY